MIHDPDSMTGSTNERHNSPGGEMAAAVPGLELGRSLYARYAETPGVIQGGGVLESVSRIARFSASRVSILGQVQQRWPVASVAQRLSPLPLIRLARSKIQRFLPPAVARAVSLAVKETRTEASPERLVPTARETFPHAQSSAREHTKPTSAVAGDSHSPAEPAVSSESVASPAMPLTLSPASVESRPVRRFPSIDQVAATPLAQTNIDHVDATPGRQFQAASPTLRHEADLGLTKISVQRATAEAVSPVVVSDMVLKSAEPKARPSSSQDKRAGSISAETMRTVFNSRQNPASPVPGAGLVLRSVAEGAPLGSREMHAYFHPAVKIVSAAGAETGSLQMMHASPVETSAPSQADAATPRTSDLPGGEPGGATSVVPLANSGPSLTRAFAGRGASMFKTHVGDLGTGLIERYSETAISRSTGSAGPGIPVTVAPTLQRALPLSKANGDRPLAQLRPLSAQPDSLTSASTVERRESHLSPGEGALRVDSALPQSAPVVHRKAAPHQSADEREASGSSATASVSGGGGENLIEAIPAADEAFVAAETTTVTDPECATPIHATPTLVQRAPASAAASISVERVEHVEAPAKCGGNMLRQGHALSEAEAQKTTVSEISVTRPLPVGSSEQHAGLSQHVLHRRAISATPRTAQRHYRSAVPASEAGSPLVLRRDISFNAQSSHGVSAGCSSWNELPAPSQFDHPMPQAPTISDRLQRSPAGSDGGARPSSIPSSVEMPQSPAPAQSQAQSSADLTQLANRVYSLLVRRLSAERQRKGI